MERMLAALAYWVGLACTVFALIQRGFAAMNISDLPHALDSAKLPLSYKSFMDGAILMFVISIASSLIARPRTDTE
jgi:hypothetical protein